MNQLWMEDVKVFFSFIFSASPGFKNFKQFRSFLLKKVNIDKIGDISFYLEDDDGKGDWFLGWDFNVQCC